MAKKITLKKLLPHINIPNLTKVAQGLSDAGHTEDEIVDDIVALVDATVHWDKIIPGPVGAAVEAFDGPVATALAHFILGLIRKK